MADPSSGAAISQVQGRGSLTSTISAASTARRPVAAAATTATVATASTDGVGAEVAAAVALGHLSQLFASGGQPPAFLIPIYKAAGRRYHVPWQVLAAVNAIETDYGRNLTVSSAGALGWMQFMPTTWLKYGVAVDHDGKPNPYDPRDAIFAAARFLIANGARHNLPRAIYAYNHAGWYVDEVLWTAQTITDRDLRPSSAARLKLAAMRTTAELLNGLPYVYGGGHSSWMIARGYDCSGFVSSVLHAAGYLSAPVSTQTLVVQPGMLSGPGRWVTIFDRTDAATTSEDHVIIDLNGQWWESGGSTDASGGARVHRMAGVSAAYLSTFNRILHPRGL